MCTFGLGNVGLNQADERRWCPTRRCCRSTRDPVDKLRDALCPLLEVGLLEGMGATAATETRAATAAGPGAVGVAAGPRVAEVVAAASSAGGQVASAVGVKEMAAMAG